MDPADEGEEASSTRQQRRRRPRPGAEPSAELAPDSLPNRGRSRRAVAPLASTMPSALGEKLHLQDRQLLSAPLRVDEADLFPLDQEPTYITQPPVPTLGGEGVERYAESMGRQQRFRRMPAQADGEQLATAAGPEHSGATHVPPPPSGGTQAAFTLFGLMYHASGGMLAGITLAQTRRHRPLAPGLHRHGRPPRVQARAPYIAHGAWRAARRSAASTLAPLHAPLPSARSASAVCTRLCTHLKRYPARGACAVCTQRLACCHPAAPAATLHSLPAATLQAHPLERAHGLAHRPLRCPRGAAAAARRSLPPWQATASSPPLMPPASAVAAP
eukprot:scaffold76848_cov66-Phaeocystis_antarctica.AAC.5